MSEDKSAIRNAATVIVLRNRLTDPSILMGQRGAKAAFMPSKFVFPGGAVDSGDATIELAHPLNDACTARLEEDIIVPPISPSSLATAAIRELWEETGQILGVADTSWHPPSADWEDFAATGHRPAASALQFVFRALTPPGRPRRFDARFFLVDADALQSDLDDFSAASDELSHLQWVRIEDARKFDMPFITEVVISEIAARASSKTAPDSVPFFKNSEEENLFLRLRGYPMPQD